MIRSYSLRDLVVCHNSVLGRVFEISRPTAYRLLKKCKKYGEIRLEAQSRAPYNHPNNTSTAVETAILYFRNKYENWGARKIKGCSFTTILKTTKKIEYFIQA